MGTIPHISYAQTLAQEIVNTIPEPFLVMDRQFRVIDASRSFYEIFKVKPAQTCGALLYSLGDGQWDIPALRPLLDAVIPEKAAIDGFEVEHDFPMIGRRTMLLNARNILSEENPDSTILLTFTDVTARRAVEKANDELLAQTEELLRQKQTLLQEMQHRVANSLQIIASILMLKARAVSSKETRHHLEEAHQRVMSIAAVQLHLHESSGIDQIDVGTYLTKLCGSLARSMIGDSQAIEIKVIAHEGTIESGKAVSLGLIVTELLINAIKYAFPTNRAGGLILVTYEIDGADWKLTVSDNGIGRSVATESREGLGTTIVKSLTKQLDAKLEMTNGPSGCSVSITRASFTSHMPQAA